MNTPFKHVRIGDWGDVQGGRQKSPLLTAGSPRPYLRVANVFDGHISYEDVKEMVFTDEEFERYRLEPGDILLNEGQSRDLVGRSAVFDRDPHRFAFQNTLIRFRAGPECFPEFAQPLFQHLRETGVFSRVAKQTTSIAHLGVSRFANIVVPCPPREVQAAVGSVLRRVHSALSAVESLVSAKQDFRRGLMQCLLAGRRRFPRFGADWRHVPLHEIASESRLRGPDGETAVMSCTKHNGLVPSLEFFGKQVFSRDLADYKRVLPGQFAYATNHIEEGSIGLLRGERPGLVSPMYTVFDCDRSRVDLEFLYYVLKSARYVRRYQALTSGSINRRGSLRWSVFKLIDVPLPEMLEQKRISELLGGVDSEIFHLQSLAGQLREQKRGLMQRLFSGDLDFSKLGERYAESQA